MKTLVIVLCLLAEGLYGQCLTIDSMVVMAPACVNGNCQTGSGIVTGAQMRAAMSWQFQVEGHNLCKVKAPTRGIWRVTVAFYDHDNVRIGINTLYVSSLLAGEKFRHIFDIPAEVIATGKPETVKIRAIVESPDIN
jgi:hypothetical protein